MVFIPKGLIIFAENFETFLFVIEKALGFKYFIMATSRYRSKLILSLKKSLGLVANSHH